jgi:hypothetical protein
VLVDAPGLITVVIWQGRVSQLRIHYLPGVVSWRLGRGGPSRPPTPRGDGGPPAAAAARRNEPTNKCRPRGCSRSPAPMPPGPRLWRDPRGEGRFTELLYSCALFQLSRNRYILPRDASRASAVWPWIGVVRAGARLGRSTRGRCVLVYHYNQPLQPKPLLRHVAQTATATTSTLAKSRNTIWNTIAVRVLPACSLPGSHFLRSVARSFALLQATGNHGGAARFQTNEDQ